MKEVDDECSGFDAARWRICVGDQREEEEGWAGCYTALPSLSNLCLGGWGSERQRSSTVAGGTA
jgi:hypothetical protein